MLYDTHAHLDFSSTEQLTSALDGARNAGIAGWMVPGVTLTEEPPPALRERPDVSVALGLHPGFLPADVGEHSLDEALQGLESRAHGFGARALGECGLDARAPTPLSVQQRWFEAQLSLARALDLPVLLHQVGARREFLESLERAGHGVRGILHGFSGDVGWAKALIRRGLLLGIGPGLLSSERARLAEVAREMPLASLVLETDLPKARGDDFAPLVLVEVAKRLATLRTMSVVDVARVTTDSALGLFRLNAV